MAEQGPLPALLDPVEALRVEKEKLKLLTDGKPSAEILVVSDLHLGRGREPDTRRFFGTENFVSDQAFARWLSAMQPSENKLLILNGDTFDFIRISNVPTLDKDFDNWSLWLTRAGMPKSADELKKSTVISKKEKTFGLQTDDYKCVWKLLQIYLGHREFFRALSIWVRDGGLLLMLKGNHDLELYWPLVRNAFGAFLKSEGASASDIQRRFFYCDDSLRIGNLYIEHGHIYDSEQEMVEGQTLPDDPSQLNLPLATFVARYLINPLENLRPFLGSIRPTQRIPWIILRNHPLAGIMILRRGLTFLRRALVLPNKRNTFWYVIFFGAVILPFLVLAIALLMLDPKIRAWIIGTHPRSSLILGALGLFFPYIAAAGHEFYLWLKRRRPRPVGEDELGQGVYQKIQNEIRNRPFPEGQQIYALMGHTHDQDVQSLQVPGGPHVLYLNTGSWIPVWPEDRPDLDGLVLYPFVRFELRGGEYRHCYFEWRDDRNQPAEVYIMAPSSKK
jgi:UDP-2,3-diacylglucosamine pyrophosphatase LpxH